MRIFSFLLTYYGGSKTMWIVKKFGGTSFANYERIFYVGHRCIEE